MIRSLFLINSNLEYSQRKRLNIKKDIWTFSEMRNRINARSNFLFLFSRENGAKFENIRANLSYYYSIRDCACWRGDRGEYSLNLLAPLSALQLFSTVIKQMASISPSGERTLVQVIWNRFHGSISVQFALEPPFSSAAGWKPTRERESERAYFSRVTVHTTFQFSVASTTTS